MYLEATETARLYQLLSEKLGPDTTDIMFKYIDNKTKRSVEATIQTLATKEETTEMLMAFNQAKVNIIKWILICGLGQVTTIIIFVLLYSSR